MTAKNVMCSVPEELHEFIKQRSLSPSKLLQRAIREEIELTVQEAAE